MHSSSYSSQVYVWFIYVHTVPSVENIKFVFYCNTVHMLQIVTQQVQLFILNCPCKELS